MKKELIRGFSVLQRLGLVNTKSKQDAINTFNRAQELAFSWELSNNYGDRTIWKGSRK